MGTFSPSSVSQVFEKIVPPAALAPSLWSVQRFFPWKSNAGTSHPLPVPGTASPCPSPGSGVAVGAGRGATLSPESSNRSLVQIILLAGCFSAGLQEDGVTQAEVQGGRAPMLTSGGASAGNALRTAEPRNYNAVRADLYFKDQILKSLLKPSGWHVLSEGHWGLGAATCPSLWHPHPPPCHLVQKHRAPVWSSPRTCWQVSPSFNTKLISPPEAQLLLESITTLKNSSYFCMY